MDLEKCIPVQSEKYLGRIDAVRELLALNKADPTLLKQRISDLHTAHLQVMRCMYPDDPEQYPRVLQLKNTLITHEIFLDTSSPGNITVNPILRGKAEKTFEYIANHVRDEWSFITTTPDPNQRMSKMLMKGYARLLQVFNPTVEGLAEKYELAILEVLGNDFPDSVLAKDLISLQDI